MSILSRTFTLGLFHRAIPSKAARILLRIVLCVGVLGMTALAQLPNCPEPWASAPYVVGVVSISGSGTATQGTLTQKTNQSATVNTVAQSFGPQSCAFMAVRGQNFGQLDSTASVNDSLQESTTGNTFTWVGSGPGDYVGAQTSFAVVTPTTYNFYAGDAVSGIFTNTGQPPATEELIWGPGSGGATLLNVPMPAGSGMVWGTSSFAAPPFETAQGAGTINANWTMDWMFAAAPDDNCKPCHENRGSDISTQDQSLGEDISISGTPFTLHYESSRSAGFVGTDLFAMLDARNLGGWTLSAHHVMEPILQTYCVGGGCTPYATVPKALFLGDGTYRTDAEVQAAVPLNGNLYIGSEDGSEVYVFNPQGLHLQTLAPMTGAVVYNFTYDAANRLTKITDANNNSTTIQRNASGVPTTIVSPFGQRTKLLVDANGFLKQVTDPVGNIIKMTNSSTGLLSSYTDAKGNVFSFVYDGNGRLTKDTDPVGGIINVARTAVTNGHSVTKTTAQGRSSTYKTVFTSSPAQTVQAFTNTWENGLQAAETDTQSANQLTSALTLPDGSSLSLTQGPDPRWGIQVPITTSETLTKGSLTMNVTGSRTANFTAGDPFSLVTETSTATINGRTYQTVFTTANKTFVETTPAGRKFTMVLDAQERPSTIQMTGMALNKFVYDARGRLSSLTQGARKYSFTHGTNGFVASFTDPLSQKSTFTYDADGHVVSATLASGQVLSNTIDANGLLATLTTPAGGIHTFGYSNVDEPISYTPPAVTGSGTTAYTFDADRDFTKITRADGQVISYTYDSAGRLTTVTTPTVTDTFTYSPTSGLVNGAAVMGGESITYGYNGPLRISTQWSGSVAGTVSRAFDNNFWISSQAVTGGTTVNYLRDNDGLSTKAGLLVVRRSPTTGLVTGTTLAKISDAIVNNTFGEMTSYTAKFTTTPIYSAVITRDNLGRISSNNETIGGVSTIYGYTYDAAGRLTGVSHNGAAAASYAYDADSNRGSVVNSSGTATATYDAEDRLLTYGSASYAYSPDGELTSKTIASQTTSYQYDALGNLAGVTLPSATALSYVVDAENKRVGKRVNGVLTAGYLYDGDHVVALLNGSGQITEQFVYSGISNTPDYMIKSGVNYRIVSDPAGSPRLVVNSATGVIAERIDYDEFGNIINDTSPGFQPFGFAGGLYDPDTKLVHFGARDYDASVGRFTSKDPVLFHGGDFNLYAYAGSDPVNRNDFSGNEPEDVGLAVVDAWMTASGVGGWSTAKTVCKTLLKAQDDGLVAIKNAAFDKVKKSMGPRNEQETLQKEVVKNVPAAKEQGNSVRKVANGLIDNTAGQTTTVKTGGKPCPCQSQPAPQVPDSKQIDQKDGSARQRANEAANAY